MFERLTSRIVCGLSVVLLSSAGPVALAQTAGAPVTLTEQAAEAKPPAPTVDQLDPQASAGLKVDARLPAECGGAILPADLVQRTRILATCGADLKARADVMTALEQLQTATNKSVGPLPDPDTAVSSLSARTKPADQLSVSDAGDKGVIADDGRRKVAGATGQGAGDIEEISSLSELSLVAGGCPAGDRPVCVAIFSAGSNKYSVQKVGDPIAKNARVVQIAGKGAEVAVTVELRPASGKPSRKEFRL